MNSVVVLVSSNTRSRPTCEYRSNIQIRMKMGMCQINRGAENSPKPPKGLQHSDNTKGGVFQLAP